MTTAGEVIEMLRRHYLPENRPAAGIFAPEIGAPGGKRRADLIFQGCTAAAGYELHGHEVKVSRADVLVELDDLTKSNAWQRYCNRWWLVVSDPAFVEGLDLPATWGVMAPPSGRRTRSMTIVKPAPRLTPDDQAAALRSISTWQHWRLEQAKNRNADLAKQAAVARRLRDEAEARAPRSSPYEDTLRAQVEKIVRALGGPWGVDEAVIGRYDAQLSIEDVIEGLRDFAVVREKAKMLRIQLQNATRTLQGIVRTVDRVQLDDLDAAVKALDARRSDAA